MMRPVCTRPAAAPRRSGRRWRRRAGEGRDPRPDGGRGVRGDGRPVGGGL